MDARYQRSLHTGCCRKCTNQPQPGLNYCQRCLEQRRAISTRRRQRLAEENRCRACELPKSGCRCGLLEPPRCCNGCGAVQPRGSYCEDCVEHQRAAKAKEKADHLRAYQVWLAEMRATRAERRRQAWARRSDENTFKEKRCRRSKRRRARNKLLAINHYGGCCRSCGEPRTAFLTIDHIVEIGDKNREKGSHSTVAYVVKSGFPPGFQVLCWNCNWLKYLATRTDWRPDPLKNQVVELYGGKCACCEVRDIRLLTIDHLNNDGAKERRAMKTRNSRTLLRRLRDEGRSADYAILCRNCNSGRAINGGVCPHHISPCFQVLREAGIGISGDGNGQE